MAATEVEQKNEVNLEDFTDLREELINYVGTLKTERKTKREISRFIDDVQTELSKPIELNVRHLANWFPGIHSAALIEGERLILRRGTREYEVSVLALDPDPYMAVVREAASQVVKLLAEAEEKAAAKVIPSLQVSTRLVGGKLGVFDWRNCLLVVANTGGKAKHLIVSLSTADKESYGPFDIDAMETKEINLRHLYRILNTEVLKVTAKCEDQDARKYTGKVELRPNAKTIRVFKLAPVSPN
jgi:hypothetical protein